MPIDAGARVDASGGRPFSFLEMNVSEGLRHFSEAKRELRKQQRVRMFKQLGADKSERRLVWRATEASSVSSRRSRKDDNIAAIFIKRGTFRTPRFRVWCGGAVRKARLFEQSKGLYRK